VFLYCSILGPVISDQVEAATFEKRLLDRWKIVDAELRMDWFLIGAFDYQSMRIKHVALAWIDPVGQSGVNVECMHGKNKENQGQ
jgi:hypothetical protein